MTAPGLLALAVSMGALAGCLGGAPDSGTQPGHILVPSSAQARYAVKWTDQWLDDLDGTLTIDLDTRGATIRVNATLRVEGHMSSGSYSLWGDVDRATGIWMHVRQDERESFPIGQHRFLPDPSLWDVLDGSGGIWHLVPIGFQWLAPHRDVLPYNLTSRGASDPWELFSPCRRDCAIVRDGVLLGVEGFDRKISGHGFFPAEMQLSVRPTRPAPIVLTREHLQEGPMMRVRPELHAPWRTDQAPCEGLPCEPADWPPERSLLLGRSHLQQSLAWQQWSAGKDVHPIRSEIVHEQASTSVLGQPVLQEEALEWNFEYGDHSTQVAEFTVRVGQDLTGQWGPPVVSGPVARDISDAPFLYGPPRQGPSVPLDAAYAAIRPLLSQEVFVITVWHVPAVMTSSDLHTLEIGFATGAEYCHVSSGTGAPISCIGRED